MNSPNSWSIDQIDPNAIYALGLTYKDHIEESGESVDPENGPPIFVKEAPALLSRSSGMEVEIPSNSEIYNSLEQFNDPDLIKKLKKKFPEGFPIMMDYEVELGVVLLEDINLRDLEEEHFTPALGYFVANDLSMRSVQILGEKQDDKYDYWSVSKSYSGFLPVGNLYVPAAPLTLKAWPDWTIETTVNGIRKQFSKVNEMVYSPKQMLEFLTRETGQEILPRGTTLITGTPSGVAFKVSWWKKFFADLFFLSRVTKLSIAAKDAKKNPDFLKSGDVVITTLEAGSFKDAREVTIR